MKQHAHIFLSYSRKDKRQARALERALAKRGLHVWLDVRSIAAGTLWFEAIEKGIRDARGVVVLLTPSSVTSEWVTYEYALATGARVPIVAVVQTGSEIPVPIRAFQVVNQSVASKAAKQIDEWIHAQSRSAAQKRASTPKLIASFQEENGKLCPASSGSKPPLWIDLWIEQAPRETTAVAFEILDVGFRDRKWTVRRARRQRESIREFLTDDMNSYELIRRHRDLGSRRGSR